MKRNLFNSGIIIFSLFALILTGTGCKSKQKIAEEQAAAAYAEKVEKAKKDLLEIINDKGAMTLEEKEKRLAAIKSLNIEDEEVQNLIKQAEDILAKLRKEQEEKERTKKEDAEKQKFAQFKNSVLAGFQSVANSRNFEEANLRIANALKLFASDDTPLFVIISMQNGNKDYDRPTTIKKYLEYLKDVRKFDKEIESFKQDNNGKITEIELIKK